MTASGWGAEKCGSQVYPRVNHLTLVAALAGPLQGFAPVLEDVLAFIAQPGGRRSSPP